MLARTFKVSLLILFAAAAARGEDSGDAVSSRDLGMKALETTLSYLKNSDPDVRAQAAEVLGQAGNKSAAGVLRKMLSDRDKHTRIAAGEALWELGDPSGLKVIYGIIEDLPASRPDNNSPLEELKIISQNKIREHAIEAFARMKGEKAGNMLYKLKNDPFGPVRDAAARELARLGYSEELTQFLDAVTSEDEAVRYQGASILAKICAPSAAEPLGALLSSENSMRVRIAALEALGCSQGGKYVLPELLRLADDPNPTLRFKAVQALSSVRDKRAFEKLKEISEGETDTGLKIAALKGLVAGGGTPGQGVLAHAFEAGVPEVKLEALKSLYLIPDPEAKRLFQAALDDDNPSVRLQAALQVLKRFGRPRTR